MPLLNAVALYTSGFPFPYLLLYARLIATSCERTFTLKQCNYHQ